MHLYERYLDNAAAMVHVGRVRRDLRRRLLELATVTGFDIYGPAGDDLREALAAFSPSYLSWLGGFAR